MRFTRGNVDGRTPVSDLGKNITGQIYGDKGYISKTLLQKLKEKGLTLMTRVRRNMKSVNHSEFDEGLLKKRALIETVFEQIKNLSQIEHTRHRSPQNFIVHLLRGIGAYCLTPSKPELVNFSSIVILYIVGLSRIEVNFNKINN